MSTADSDPTTTRSYGLTPAEVKNLGQQATAAKALSYSPYSKFRVGCALLCDDGEIVLGANIENASYPVGVCAEKAALSRACLEGQRKFLAIAVSTDITPPASPCGMCRQFIREFCDLNLPIYMWDKDGNYVVKTLEELLPMSFGPEHLKKPDSSV
ncbi:hypothetical protein Dda_7538 [Drechslerella dactyloides]|uniref:Cytidine deaminase n=1 Tax=Drechslerella dactyloides TaxID=74499 RepID=A0AAD6ITJ3_DREDA|nr:hypothetical protein Dda_7538 [Drechslerella dactyloides]